MNNWLKLGLCLLIVYLSGISSALALPTIEDFAAHPAYSRVTISPSGEYIASIIHLGDDSGLAVIRLSDRKVTAKLVLADQHEVADYWWVSANRLVVEPAAHGSSERPRATGELVGLNADNSEHEYLFGHRGNTLNGTHPLHHLPGYYRTTPATVIDPLINDPEHALIAVADWDDDTEKPVTISYKLNIKNGQLSDRILGPQGVAARFIVDTQGTVRYAIADGSDLMKADIYQRNQSDGKWTQISKDSSDPEFPVAFGADNQTVYLLSNKESGRRCLVEKAPDGRRKSLSCDPTGDVRRLIFSFDGKEPIAVIYRVGKPKIVLLDSKHPDTQLLQRLINSFPDRIIEPVSASADGSKVVALAHSDRDPGEFFLFDTKTAKAQSLAFAYDNIDPIEMGERRPIAFTSRDGVELHGFLTIPPGKDLQQLPLVVNPHGGPFDIDDQWGWDRDAQLLATRGYAVLQVNFRGSGGLGIAFVNAGAQAWDSIMINDLTDGARWAVQQGFGDGKRLCIYGVSYGGYAAMMSAVREPDLYRCVIAVSGIYDLNLFAKDSDVATGAQGKKYISDYIGATPERLKAASPLAYIDKLKSAILIVHGKNDLRTPYSQAKALQDALDDHHFLYERLIKSSEGHGFYAPENRVELYTRILAFLDKNIGQATSVADTSAAVPATSKP